MEYIARKALDELDLSAMGYMSERLANIVSELGSIKSDHSIPGPIGKE